MTAGQELPLRSAVPGIVWPAVPDRRGAQMLALLSEFEHTERLPPEDLQRLQFTQLHGLLTHAQRHSPYYRNLLTQVGFDPGKPLAADLWHRIPVLSRDQVRDGAAELRCREIPREHGRTGVVSTSGSTGVPVRVARSDLSQFLWDTITVRDHLWQRRDFTGTLAAIRTVTKEIEVDREGRSAAHWGRASATLFATGPSHALTVRTEIPRQVAWLRRRGPTYLLTYPGNLAELLEYAQANDLRLPTLKGIICVTGPVTPELRDRCQALWGLAISDMYSCEEVGYLGLQCPETDHYHVPAETVLVEIVDDRNRPVAPGQTGRVLATPLHNFAMPLIRYELGDYAEAGAAACRCGRTLPVMSRILGRRRNRVHLPDGRRGWPKFGDTKLFREIAPVERFQIVQHSLDDVELVAALPVDLTPGQREKLADAVRSVLGYPFPVRITRVESIPLAANGKYEVFVTKLG